MNATFFRICFLSTTMMALALFGLVEAGAGFPVAWWLYLGASIGFTAAILRRKPWRLQPIRIAFSFGFVILACALYFTPWNSRKVFLRDLNRVQPGMTEAEVRSIMAAYMEGTGWPSFASAGSNTPLWIAGSDSRFLAQTSADGEMQIRDNLVFRHSNDGAYNADWGIITLSNGVVTGVQFSPD